MISSNECKLAVMDWITQNIHKVHHDVALGMNDLSDIKRIFKRKINGVETRLYEAIGAVFIIKVVSDKIDSVELFTRKMYFDNYASMFEVKDSWGWSMSKYLTETMWAGKLVTVSTTPEWDLEGTPIGGLA